MKFKELRPLLDCAALMIGVEREGRETSYEAIHAQFTEDAARRRARYDEAEVVRIRPTETQWARSAKYLTLEVTLREP